MTPKPSVHHAAAGSATVQFASVVAPAAVDVVDRQERQLYFPTAGALSAIGRHDIGTQFGIISLPIDGPLLSVTGNAKGGVSDRGSPPTVATPESRERLKRMNLLALRTSPLARRQWDLEAWALRTTAVAALSCYSVSRGAYTAIRSRARRKCGEGKKPETSGAPSCSARADSSPLEIGDPIVVTRESCHAYKSTTEVATMIENRKG